MRRKPTQYRITGRDALFVTDGARVYLNLPGEFYQDIRELASPAPEEVRQMLLQIRQERRWPHAYMAAVLGVSKEVLRKWLSGERHPTGAAKKLIWLLHDILCHGGKVHNHRDIASWGDRFLGHVVLAKEGNETYALPSRAVPPQYTQEMLAQIIRDNPGLRSFKAFKTPHEPDPPLAEQPEDDSASGTGETLLQTDPAPTSPACTGVSSRAGTA